MSSSNITDRNEFAARLFARQKMLNAGAKAQASNAARLAAKLYRSGKPAYQAAREAARQCRPAFGIEGGAA